MDVGLDVIASLATKNDVKALAALVPPDPFQARVQIGFDGVTNAAGNLTLRVYDVPDGKTFFLYKLIIWVAGINPGQTAVLGASPGVGIYHGQSGGTATLADWGPNNGGTFVLPCTFEYNSHTAPEFRAPDNIMVQLFNGPVSTNVVALGWGELFEKVSQKNY
jgi:hypothetical protein